MSKQTAVEWLEERFEKFLAYYEGHHKAEMYSIHQLSNDFDQAKAIEKEQIIEAWDRGQYIGTHFYGKQIAKTHEQNAEQYYNQIYIE